MADLDEPTFYTAGGIAVERVVDDLTGEGTSLDDPIEDLIDALDHREGVLLTSTYEYPGRYSRWDIGFVDPAVVVTARGRRVGLAAKTDGGRVLVAALSELLPRFVDPAAVESTDNDGTRLSIVVSEPSSSFDESERSRQPSVFSVLRGIIAALKSTDDASLGLYGAFGYDLAFQFEPIALEHERSSRQRDLVLYIPDQIVVVDRRRETAKRLRYGFAFDSTDTGTNIRSDVPEVWSVAGATPQADSVEPAAVPEHRRGHFKQLVELAKESFARGDLFEVTPSQVFSRPVDAAPSEIFRRLRERNPAPYGALINLGNDEYLIAASPEMYVRVEGTRVETCPIAGTIARGEDVMGDAEQIRTLLRSSKDESELTMCTDVDRNDKSRICEPDSIRVMGRRQIEMYSRLIHTVDHVEGTLLPQFDALDAFLAHTWAVTVTGAPKLWAMRFIEKNEGSPRRWYGAAIGALFFNGNANTGLTLRTIHLEGGVAQVRAGATLLMDSDPEEEERETETKASALLDAISRPTEAGESPHEGARSGAGKSVLLVDHEDSFVHTLAGYFRRTGADVTTVRVPVGTSLDPAVLDRKDFDLVVISPGPGRPSDFKLDQTLDAVIAKGMPVFGVCLGLQALVEHFGGSLGQLDYPMHGKPSTISNAGGRYLASLPDSFEAGRYHSLIAQPESLPAELKVTMTTEDGVIMAVEHAALPIAAVQFHPESLMTMRSEIGMRLVDDVIRNLARSAASDHQ